MLEYGQKALFWSHATIKTFPHILSNLHTCLVVDLLKQWLLCATLQSSAFVWIGLKIVGSYTCTPIPATDFSRLFRVKAGLVVTHTC